MKPLKELRSEKSNKFIDDNEGHGCSVSYECGWDACLEELSKSAGEEFDDTKVQAWFNQRPFDRVKNFREIDLVIDAASFQHQQDQLIIQSLRLRLRIAELEGELCGS